MHCFVCCEDAEPLYRVCRCDVRIHASCFRALVTEVTSHREGCPVCTRPYHTRVVACPPRARAACVLLFLWMGIFVCQAALLLTLVIRPFQDGRLNALNVVAMGCLLLVLIAALGCARARSIGGPGGATCRGHSFTYPLSQLDAQCS